jgi:tripartite-type tricarboxylate transporter receptor subunit TctC
VPYKGSAQAHLDIIGGQVEIMFDTTSSAMAQIKAGKFKPLAVTTPTRSAQLPQVPTLAEAGVRGADMSTWYALYATAGTPADVVARLQAELARIIKLPDVDARLRGLGGEPGNITPAQFAEFNKQEFDRFGKLIRDAGIKLQ